MRGRSGTCSIRARCQVELASGRRSCTRVGSTTMPERASSSSPASPPPSRFHRRLPIGAEPIDSQTTHVRVWASRARRVEVVTESGEPTPLEPDGEGYFGGVVTASTGDRYRFKLDDDETLYPDPASRFQPDGPHGPSVIVDPRDFAWTDHAWAGARSAARSSTSCTSARSRPTGTWAARRARACRSWRAIGVTMIEVMPVAEFDGRFGWGYDGVDLYAPTRLYGSPDDFRRFVDRAHGCGVGRHPRRRLQPSRAGRELSARVLARVFHRSLRQRVGRRDQLRRRRRGAGPRVLHRPTPATGSTSSTSTDCASTRPSRSTIDPPSTS